MKPRISLVLAICCVLSLFICGSALASDIDVDLESRMYINAQLDENFEPDYESAYTDYISLHLEVSEPTQFQQDFGGLMYIDAPVVFLTEGGLLEEIASGDPIDLKYDSQIWWTDDESGNNYYRFIPWFGSDASKGLSEKIVSPDHSTFSVVSWDIAGTTGQGAVPQYEQLESMNYLPFIILTEDCNGNLGSVEWKIIDKNDSEEAITYGEYPVYQLRRIEIYCAKSNYWDRNTITILGDGQTFETDTEVLEYQNNGLTESIPMDNIEKVRVTYYVDGEDTFNYHYDWYFYPKQEISGVETISHFRFDMDRDFVSNMELTDSHTTVELVNYFPDGGEDPEAESIDVAFDTNVTFASWGRDLSFDLASGEEVTFEFATSDDQTFGAVDYYAPLLEDGNWYYHVISPDLHDGGVITIDGETWNLLPVIPYDEFGCEPAIVINQTDGKLASIFWCMMDENGDIAGYDTANIDQLYSMRVAVASGDLEVQYRIKPRVGFSGTDSLQYEGVLNESTALNRVYRGVTGPTQTEWDLLSGSESNPEIMVDDITSIRFKVIMNGDNDITKNYEFYFVRNADEVIFDDDTVGMEKVTIPEVDLSGEEGLESVDPAKVDMDPANFSEGDEVTDENIEKVLNCVEFELAYDGPATQDDLALPLQLEFRSSSADLGTELWNTVKEGELDTVLDNIHIYKVLEGTEDPVDLVDMISESDYSKYFACETNDNELFITANLMIIDSDESKIETVSNADYSHFRVWDGTKNNKFSDPILTAQYEEPVVTPPTTPPSTTTSSGGGGGGCNVAGLSISGLMLLAPLFFLKRRNVR